ncbi:iron ABC transporter permease [Christensenellaceae bacterium OttesenSCG-928-K19]|nr:iron ABC transporter permease [Christensenellaceae bacterium OttesenSCG-928-K19]
MNTCTSASISKPRKNFYIATMALAIAIAALFIVSMTKGAASVSLVDVTNDMDIQTYNIIMYIRLPRTIAGLLSGAALAVSGLLLQTTLNNRLASPGIVGVNAGAGLFVVAAAILFPAVLQTKYLAAFAGALVTVLIIYAIARKTGATRVTLLLAGVAVGSLLSAFSDALVTLHPQVLPDKNAFFIGGFASVSSQSVMWAWPFIAFGLLIAVLLNRRLDVLALGDEMAASLGVRVELCRFLSILSAAALAAGAVSMAGLIGFVGLIVPNLVRMITPGGHRFTIPLAALLGAALVLFCDILARLLFIPYEIPVGILLSVIGAPFFIYILFKKKWSRSYD